MSAYSGKYDFFDYFSRDSDENDWDKIYENFKGTELYVCRPEGNILLLDKSQMESNWEKIEYRSVEDLIPYFTYIIAVHSHSQDKDLIVLSREDYVEKQENERLERILQECLKYYRKCKRKHEEFDVDECFKNTYFVVTSSEKDVIEEIARRVKENGKTTNVNGLHTKLYQWFRDRLKADIKFYHMEKEKTNENVSMYKP